MKYDIFFHVVDEGNWGSYVGTKISLLKEKGVWDGAEEIIFVCHYDPNRFKAFATSLAHDPRVKIYSSVDIPKPYGKLYTDRLLKFFCDRYAEPRALLYLQYEKPVDEKISRYLDYWNIEQWKNSMRLIEEGYDMVGADWAWGLEIPHYRGDMYWVSSNYIKKLAPCPIQEEFLSDPNLDIKKWFFSGNPKFYTWSDHMSESISDESMLPDRYRLDSRRPMKLPIRIYYHISDRPHWEELVESKIVLFKKYGLWNRAQEIIFLAHYDSSNFDDFKKRHGSDPRIRIYSDKPGHPPYGECYSNRTMWWDIMHRTDPMAILRFHAKGLMHIKGPDAEVAMRWNDYFDYWLIERWRDCHAALEEGYDLAGANWHEPKHFSGNLWWARSDYIRRLPYLKAPHENNFLKQIPTAFSTRHDAECWVGLCDDIKVKEFHHYEHAVVYHITPPDPKEYRSK